MRSEPWFCDQVPYLAPFEQINLEFIGARKKALSVLILFIDDMPARHRRNSFIVNLKNKNNLFLFGAIAQ
jgi:hypothetical protein